MHIGGRTVAFFYHHFDYASAVLNNVCAARRFHVDLYSKRLFHYLNNNGNISIAPLVVANWVGKLDHVGNFHCASCCHLRLRSRNVSVALHPIVCRSSKSSIKR